MNDINKVPKRSLRDIFPENHVQVNEINEQIISEPILRNHTENVAEKTQIRRGSSWTKNAFLGVLILVMVLGGGYVFSKSLSRITVKVTPKQGRLLVNNIYDASKGSDADLKFALASEMADEAKTIIPATGKELVKEKATGQIVVYNNYSSQAQIFIKNTRFESKGGLIYRIGNQITVPGTTKNIKGEIIPGQLTVNVTAEQTGSKYNITQSDFTIPGLKGSAKYKKFYGRSKVAFTGGFEGERVKISLSDKTKAEADLKNKLTASLIKKLKAQVPNDYILFDDAIILSLNPITTKFLTSGNQAEVSLQAEATGILLDKKELSKFLAQKQIPNYQGEDVVIDNWSEMKFSIIDKETINVSNLNEISFKLEGNGHLVWSYSEKKLKEKLTLANTNNYRQVFEKYFPTIQMASISFSPPWVRSIPTNQNRIKVETVTSRP